MDDNTVKPGAVLRLKSGGPPMTYANRDEEGRAVCMFFDKENVLHTLGFGLDFLTMFREDQCHSAKHGLTSNAGKQ